jgi:hypothetical protein
MRFTRAAEPEEFGRDSLEWAPSGVREVEVLRWYAPADGALLLEVRFAVPPAGHGKTLCIVEPRTPEAERAALVLLPETNAMGLHYTDDGSIYHMWAYSVVYPAAKWPAA